jgi:hypothetical protein
MAVDTRTPQTEEIEVQVQAPTHEGAKQVESIYSNAVSFVATAFDVRFIFGEIVPLPNGKLVNESRVSVIMSWEHAKAMYDFLKNNIEQHERDFGPLHYKKRSE